MFRTSFDYTILIDSREKEGAYSFPGIKTKIQKLEYGDYSLEGCEREIVIERKSFTDFWNSLTKRQHQFFDELTVMHNFRYPFLFLDCELREYKDSGISQSSYNSLVGFIHKIFLDLRIPCYFVGNNGAFVAFRLFDQFWRKWKYLKK